MRYLKLIILFLAYAVISPAFADVCCPSGCVPTYAYNSTVCLRGYPEFLRLWLHLRRRFWKIVGRFRLGTDLRVPASGSSAMHPIESDQSSGGRRDQ